MNVVTCHVGADFDSLASMVAAAKLYPEAVPVLAGSADRRVREFCNLFADSLALVRSRDIERDEIDTLVVVDCNDARRLGAFRELAQSGKVRVHVYDHHPVETQGEGTYGLSPEVFVSESVGATTTLLLDRIPAETPIDSKEATLFALGIYEETGCLVYPSTTVRDVECVARLLKRGANLEVVAAYVNRSLEADQRALLDDLVMHSEYREMRGLPVCLAKAEVEGFVGGVAILTSKLLDIQNVAVALSVVQQEDSVLVVGRSRVDAVDLSAVMADLGGGGHHRAASAVLRDASLAEALPQVEEALERHMVELATAESIMSYPVRSVTPDTTVADAARVMLRYGHSGLLVVGEGGGIEGIVTRKDVDGAQHHNLSHAPVRYCMTREVETAAPGDSVLELESRMADSTVGRIPIVGDGELLGIVTRSDVLRALYNCVSPWHRLTYRRAPQAGGVNVAERLAANLPADQVELLRWLGRLGAESGAPCSLVGGSVRDLLLDAPNLDIDLLVEGDAIELARAAAAQREGATVREHGRFGTAQLELPEDQKIDFATARTEFYEHAAALPEVERSSLREDLYRRDFTINTMAVDLAPERFGELIDHFGGEQDLREGVIRVLHNLSFVEDPTRMFRAVRFEQRFGFSMDPQTEALITAARDPNALAALTPERLRNELILLLKEPDPIPALHRLSHLDLLKEIDPSLAFDEEVLVHLRRMETVRGWARTALPEESLLEWPLMLWPLLAPLAVVTVRALCEGLRFDLRVSGVLTSAQESASALAATLNSLRELKDSALRCLLMEIPTEVQVAALSVRDSELARARVEHFHGKLKGATADVSGDDLKALGYEPAPPFRRALDAALRVKLDETEPSREQQLQAAVAVLEQ